MIGECTTEPQARQNERLGQTMAGVIDAQHHNSGSGVQRYSIVLPTPQIVTHATAPVLRVISRALPIGGLRCSCGDSIHCPCQDTSGNSPHGEVYQERLVRFPAESHVDTFSCKLVSAQL
jgi:hypothetical protein